MEWGGACLNVLQVIAVSQELCSFSTKERRITPAEYVNVWFISDASSILHHSAPPFRFPHHSGPLLPFPHHSGPPSASRATQPPPSASRTTQAPPSASRTTQAPPLLPAPLRPPPPLPAPRTSLLSPARKGPVGTESIHGRCMKPCRGDPAHESMYRGPGAWCIALHLSLSLSTGGGDNPPPADDSFPLSGC